MDAARVLLEKGLTRPAVNRAYYAMFYAVLALLALGKKETPRHSGAIALFDKEFVREGTFPKDLSRWLHDAFDLRDVERGVVENYHFLLCDYTVRIVLAKAEVQTPTCLVVNGKVRGYQLWERKSVPLLKGGTLGDIRQFFGLHLRNGME